jgi:tetratricopeptide (TPR) repeat protein
VKRLRERIIFGLFEPGKRNTVLFFLLFETALGLVGIWLVPHLLALFFLTAGSRVMDRAIHLAGLSIPPDYACDVAPVLEPNTLESLNKAADLLRNAILFQPDEAQAHLLLARTGCLLGKPEDALQSYFKYIHLRPDNPLGYLESGFAYETLCGDLEIDNKLSDSTLEKSQYFQVCNSEMSKIMLRLRISVAAPQDFLAAGEQRRQSNLYLEAIRWYKRAIQMDPDYGLPWFFTGLAYEQQGNFDKAIESYKAAIQLSPSDYNAYYSLAGLFMNAMGDDARALEVYYTVTKIDPLPIPAYLNIGTLREKQGKKEEALFAYKKAAQLSFRVTGDSNLSIKNRVWPLYALADFYFRSGQLKNAGNTYQQALDQDPGKVYASWSLWGLGRIAKHKGLAQEAEEKFTQALLVANNKYLRSQINYQLGELKLSQAQIDEGIAYLKQAHLEDPQNQGLHRYFADELRKAGKLEDAILEYESYLSRWPNDQEVLSTLEEARKIVSGK